MSSASPINHSAQRNIASFFAKSESTPTIGNHSSAKPIDSNVSKLTPVNKKLFQDSASKPKRTNKSKLPPASQASTMKTDDSSKEIATNSVSHITPSTNEQDSVCDGVLEMAEETPSQPPDVSPTATTDAVEIISGSNEISTPVCLSAPKEDASQPVSPKPKSKPRAPRAKKAVTSKPQKTVLIVDNKPSDCPDVLLVPTPEVSNSDAGVVDDQLPSPPAGSDGTVTVDTTTVTMKVKRKRSAKAIAAAEDAEGKDEARLGGLTEMDWPLPSDVVVRLEMLKSREQGVLEALQDSLRVACAHAVSTKSGDLSVLFSLLTSGASANCEGLEQVLSRFVVHAVQDSAASLSALVSVLCEDVRTLESRVRTWRQDHGVVVAAGEDLLASACWKRCTDSLALGEWIKTLAARVSYGYRSPSDIKMCSVFEDTSSSALWRWEAIATLVGARQETGAKEDNDEAEEETTSGAGTVDPLVKDTVKNFKQDLGRAGRVIKAIHKAIDELVKCARKPAVRSGASGGAVSSLIAEDEVRVSGLEDKVTKALLEMNKGTERKQILLKKLEAQQSALEKKEKKRLEAAAEKLEKEALKQKAQAEKAQADLEASEIKKKASRVPSEKELKEQASKQKQQNMLMSFLGKKKNTASSSSSVAVAVAGAEDEDVVVQNASYQTGSGNVIGAGAGAGADDEVEVVRIVPAVNPSSRKCPQPLRVFDNEAFLSQLLSNKSLTSISDGYRQRYALRSKGSGRHESGRGAARGKRRVPLSLCVTVTSSSSADADPFGSGGDYAEIKEVQVDPRKRLFSFAEDYRPPYFGTYSKRSRVVTGRRPFALDSALMNYDYDSEAEWEEEDPDGEDIAQSDNEDDDGEGNDLLYDDFFCRDDEIDFAPGIDGTDAVGESSAAILAMRKAAGLHYKSCIAGPRFLLPGVQSGEDADCTLLRRYSAVRGGGTENSKEEQSALLRQVGTPGVLELFLSSSSSCVASSGGGEGAVISEPSESVREARSFKEAMLPRLASFVHGKKEGISKLVDGFLEQLQHQQQSEAQGVSGDTSAGYLPSKLQVRKRILEIADRKRAIDDSAPPPTPSDGGDGQTLHTAQYGSARWIVRPEAVQSLSLQLQSVDYTPAKKKARRITPVTVSALTPAAASTSSIANDSVLPHSPPRPSTSFIHASPARPSVASQHQGSLLNFFPTPGRTPGKQGQKRTCGNSEVELLPEISAPCIDLA